MRNLAHIETIDWITPIEGKDRIALAGVLGWTVIVQKTDFAVGDKECSAKSTQCSLRSRNLSSSARIISVSRQ